MGSVLYLNYIRPAALEAIEATSISKKPYARMLPSYRVWKSQCGGAAVLKIEARVVGT